MLLLLLVHNGGDPLDFIIFFLNSILKSVDLVSERVVSGLQFKYLIPEFLNFPPLTVQFFRKSLLLLELLG